MYQSENVERVGASWGNAVITGGLAPSEHRDSAQTDMRVMGRLMLECGAVTNGECCKTSCRLWEPSKYRNCYHLKFEQFCDRR